MDRTCSVCCFWDASCDIIGILNIDWLIIKNADCFSDFFFSKDAGEKIKADIEGFGCGAARLDRSDIVKIETFGCAEHWLEVVAIGVALGFHSDVFHCHTVVSFAGKHK